MTCQGGALGAAGHWGQHKSLFPNLAPSFRFIWATTIDEMVEKKLRLGMCPFSALDHGFDNEVGLLWNPASSAWNNSCLRQLRLFYLGCSNWRDSTGGTSGTSVLVVLFNGIVLAPLRSAHLFFLFTCFCVKKVLSDAIIHMLTHNFKPCFFLQMTSHCMHLSIIAIHLYNLPLYVTLLKLSCIACLYSFWLQWV